MTIQDFDIRWKQRFDNLTKLRKLFDGFQELDPEKMTPVEMAGWIHLFDLMFELSWKTMKDYIIAQWENDSLDFTREVLQAGLKHGLIDDGHIWAEMLKDRNAMTHEYSEVEAQKAVRSIQEKYFIPLSRLYEKFSGLS